MVWQINVIFWKNNGVVRLLLKAPYGISERNWCRIEIKDI